METALGLLGIGVILYWVVAPWRALRKASHLSDELARSEAALQALDRRLLEVEEQVRSARAELEALQALGGAPARGPAPQLASVHRAVVPATLPDPAPIVAPTAAAEPVVEALLVGPPLPAVESEARTRQGRVLEYLAAQAREREQAGKRDEARKSEAQRADERREAGREASRDARRRQWNDSVRPFLAENVAWFLGGFLVIAGSLYFIRLAWGVTGEIGRHLLLLAVALAYAAAFVGVGLWFKRKHNLPTPARAMAYVGLSLLPVALLDVADTWTVSRPAWLVLWPLGVAAAWPIAWLAAGLLGRELARPLAWAVASLLALLGLGRAAAAFSPAAALALPYAGWVLAHRAALQPLRAESPPPASVLAFHLSALGYTLAFLVGLSRAVAAAPAGFTWLQAIGPLAVLVAYSGLQLDLEVRARRGGEPRLDAPLVAAFCLGLAGVAVTADAGPLLPLSAALASALFAASLVWFRRPLPLLFSLGAGALAWAALLFGPGSLRSLLAQLAGRLPGAPRIGELPAALALLLLPLPLFAGRLRDRFGRIGEPRLSRAAGLAAWALILLPLALASTSDDPRRAAPTLLAAAALLAHWHRGRPSARAAWAAVVCFGAGTWLLLQWRAAGPWCLALAACALGVAAVPAMLRASRRIGAAALLQLAQLSSLGALAWAFARSESISAAGRWLPELAVAAVVWSVGAVAHGSAGMGLMAVSALGLLFWTALFGGPGASLAFLLDPLTTLHRRAVLLPIALGLLAWGGRRLSRSWRGPAGLPLVHAPLRPQTRSLHPLSEAAFALAWPAMLAVALAGVAAPRDEGASTLLLLALLSFALGHLGRSRLPAGLAGLLFVGSGALALERALRSAIPPREAAVLALGGGAVAALLLAGTTRLTPLGRQRSRQVEVLRTVAGGSLLVASATAFAACLGALLPLLAGRPAFSLAPLRPGLAAPRLWPVLLAAVDAALLPIAWRLLWNRRPSSAPVLLAGLALGLTTAVAAIATGRLGTAATAPGLYVAAPLAFAALLSAAARLVFLRRRSGDHWTTALAPFGQACAALALAASFLPPGAPFPTWPHVASDLLLAAFLGLSLACGDGPLFLHLLVVAAALLATRLRLTLGFPTQGHGLLVGAGLLLGLGLALRRKQRYAEAAFAWSLAATVAAFLRFALLLAPLAPKTDQWTWALAAALLAVPLAPQILPAFTAHLAALGGAAALLLGAAARWPAWLFSEPGTLLAPSCLALLFALLAVAARRAGSSRGAPQAPGWPRLVAPEQAAALEHAAVLLVILPACLALFGAAQVLLRLRSLRLELLPPVAFALLVCAVTLAILLAVRGRRRGDALDLLVVGASFAAATVLGALLSPRLPTAPGLVLLAFALGARAASRALPDRAARLEAAAIGLWCAALASAHLGPQDWSSPLTLAALLLVAPLERASAGVQSLGPRSWILLVAAGFAMPLWARQSVWAASLGSVGPLAVVAALLAWLRVATRQPPEGTLRMAWVAAAATVLVGFTHPTAAESIPLLAAGGLLVLLAAGPCAQREPRLFDAALAGAGALYAFWRASPLPQPLPVWVDTALPLAVALLALGLAQAGWSVARSPSLLRAATVLPFIATAVALATGPAALVARVALGAALLLGLLAWLQKTKAASRNAALAALAFGNLALFATWADQGLSDLQLYTIPLGITLLGAAQLARGDLPASGLRTLRGLGCLVLYAGTAWQMAGSDGLLFPLLLALLALATVASGAWLRVRAFLYFGAATLVVDVLSNLVRYSSRSTFVLAVSATIAGLAIMAGMAWFSVRREEATALYRRFSRSLEDWE